MIGFCTAFIRLNRVGVSSRDGVLQVGSSTEIRSASCRTLASMSCSMITMVRSRSAARAVFAVVSSITLRVSCLFMPAVCSSNSRTFWPPWQARVQFRGALINRGRREVLPVFVALYRAVPLHRALRARGCPLRHRAAEVARPMRHDRPRAARRVRAFSERTHATEEKLVFRRFIQARHG